MNIRQHFYKYYESQLEKPISVEEYSNKNPISTEKKLISDVKKPKIQHKKYKVKACDSLSEIAEKHHTSLSKLKKANGLRSDSIQIGQVLKIP